jgi:hypothetical protein
VRNELKSFSPSLGAITLQMRAHASDAFSLISFISVVETVFKFFTWRFNTDGLCKRATSERFLIASLYLATTSDDRVASSSELSLPGPLQHPGVHSGDDSCGPDEGVLHNRLSSTEAFGLRPLISGLDI